MQALRRRIARPNRIVLNVVVMAAGSWMIWYFSGPWAAELGRDLFEFTYARIWGAPVGLMRLPERLFFYIPMEGHIENVLYNFSEYVVPILAAPLLYRLPDMIRSVAHKIANTVRSLANFITNGIFGAAQMQGLNRLAMDYQPPQTLQQRTGMGRSAPATLTPARDNHINTARSNNAPTATSTPDNPPDNKMKYH